MKLEMLSSEDLRLFLNGLPVELLRDIYTNIKPLREKLKGFSGNPKKATKIILVNQSFQLVKNEKNRLLIKILSDRYNDYIEHMNGVVASLEEQGYSHDLAYAIAVKDIFNSEFRKVFYKLEDIPVEKQTKINELIDLITLVDLRANGLIAKNVNPDVDKKIDSLEKEQESLKDLTKDLNKADEALNKKLEAFDAKIEKLKQELLTAANEKVSPNELNNRIDSFLSKIKSELQKASKAEETAELKNEIKELKTKIEALPQVKTAELYEYEHFKAGDFSPMDDYLEENILDVIGKMGTPASLNVLSEYLIETIYGNRPIITTTKMIDIAADIYASIMTGGEYFSISIGEDYSHSKLIKTIEEITKEKENSVIAIKGLINRFDYRNIVNYLSLCPFTQKFLFDVHYEKEIKYMAPEMLDEFYFLLGNFPNKQIEYRYTYVFDNRKPIKNGDFEKALQQLSVELDNKELFNVKYYGLLSYSIIPFIALQRGLEKEEIVNLILDGSIRKKCEATLND